MVGGFPNVFMAFLMPVVFNTVGKHTTGTLELFCRFYSVAHCQARPFEVEPVRAGIGKKRRRKKTVLE
jgi:hypothetical protein